MDDPVFMIHVVKKNGMDLQYMTETMRDHHMKLCAMRWNRKGMRSSLPAKI